MREAVELPSLVYGCISVECILSKRSWRDAHISVVEMTLDVMNRRWSDEISFPFVMDGSSNRFVFLG